MEAIPILFLWVMMPLDSRQPIYPVRAEDLAAFPAHHVILAERMIAWHKFKYVQQRRDFSIENCLPDAEYWRALAKQAHFVWDQWDDLKLAHEVLELGDEENARYWLKRFKSFAGTLRYMHGQLPPHVDVREPTVEVVNLPD